jgi:hypothetical protein
VGISRPWVEGSATALGGVGQVGWAGTKWQAGLLPKHTSRQAKQACGRAGGRAGSHSAGGQRSTHLSDVKVWRLHLQRGRRLCQQGVQAGQLVWAHQHRGGNVLQQQDLGDKQAGQASREGRGGQANSCSERYRGDDCALTHRVCLRRRHSGKYWAPPLLHRAK